MREALLRRCKYVAVVNNYGDAEETMEYLTNRGNRVRVFWHMIRHDSFLRNTIEGRLREKVAAEDLVEAV